MNDELRWAYAINQWNRRMDLFVRHEEQQRAFKTLSVLGFRHIELSAGSGRWDNLGRPEVIRINHGSADGFLAFLAAGGIDGVSSMYWDPAQPCEEEGWVFRSTRSAADHDAIVASARPFIEFLASVGADQLVARAVGSAWMAPPLAEGELAVIADVWNRIGAEASAAGVGLSLHLDCLGPIRTTDQIAALLDATDPSHVGLALDTAELTVAGIDPVAALERWADRVTHVQLKNTRFADAGDEYLTPGAESSMLRGGGGRHIERWFFELGADGGLVDVEGFVGALRRHGYTGWVVVESDQGGNAAELAMLNSWYLQQRLDVTRT